MTNVTAMFKLRYHFQFQQRDGVWQSVMGHNEPDLAAENFALEAGSGAWANAIRLFDVEEGKTISEVACDSTGGITLDDLDARLAKGETPEQIQKDLEAKAIEKALPAGTVLPFNQD